MRPVLAKQIKEVQGDLADLNVLEDQISQHVESSEVLDDYEDLKAKNDRQVRVCRGPLVCARTCIASGPDAPGGA